MMSKGTPPSDTCIYDHDHDIWKSPSSEEPKMSNSICKITINNINTRRNSVDLSSSVINIEESPMTPTTPSTRIPEIDIEYCPPAPKKPKSRPILKRKCSSSDASSSNIHNVTRLLDFSKEIDSMSPPFLQANLGCKIKKARSI